jgi:hypothetical protein
MTSRRARIFSTAPAFADGIPACPPPEVLDAIGDAAAAYDRLRASGRQVLLDLHPVTGKLAASVIDAEGNPVGTLSATQVLDLAAGDPLD